MSDYTVHVQGLTELRRELKQISKDLDKELRKSLREIAEPVRRDAERLAQERISHIGPTWGRMRAGVLTSAVYIAPKQRSKGKGPQKRPNLGPLLVEEAMIPALEQHEHMVVHEFEQVLDRLIDRHGL